MNQPYKHPASNQALRIGSWYAEYIERTINERVAAGHWSEEFVNSASLGDLFHANDGD